MIKKLFNLLLVFQLSVGESLLLAGSADVEYQTRTEELITSFMKNSSPSDLPFVDYMESFYHNKIQPLKKFDLSKFEGKKIYIGYGIFDSAQNYCKYIEKPDLDTTSTTDQIKTYFTSIRSFSQHTYALSINKMSFDSCLTLTNKFGGYIATPTTQSENGFLSGSYNQKEKWLGIEKAGCSSSYVNQEDKTQEYFNWKTTSQEVCDSNKLKIMQNAFGKWETANGSVESNYCVMEVDSEDINRPVKVCAPWWRIEREYAKTADTTYGGVNIYRINQADIPEQFNVCTQYKTEDINASTVSRRVSCTTYYDATVAEGCLKNPLQAICFVDECSGYIENACTHVQELVPYKDYTKTQAMIDGTLQWIKAKANIRSQVYDCPPSPPSINSCTEKSSVLIYPKECPNSQCDLLKECTYGAKEKEELDACNAKYTCEKIYGSPDNPVIDPVTGELNNLIGICEDGTKLSFELNVQNKINRKCLSYDTYTTSKEIAQNCVLDRPYSDYTVNTSLTASDIYMNNPSCIRLNNILEARPVQEVTFEYNNKGYSKTLIKKSFIDDNQSIGVYDGFDDIVISPSETKTQSNSGTAEVTNSASSTALTCPSETWSNKIENIMNNANVKYIASNAYDSSVPVGKMKIRLEGITSSSDCSSLVSSLNGIGYDYQGGNVCNIYFTKDTEDKFKYISKDSDSSYTFVSEIAISKSECKSYASCLGGPYNETDFGSGNAICKVYPYDDYVEEDTTTTLTETLSTTNACRPPKNNGAYASQLNGVQDIFSVQEEVGGEFGYYSNYTTPAFLNNVIKVNGKEIYPIKPTPQIDDPLIYKGDFRQDSILTKKPNFVAGAAGGAVAYGAATAYTSYIAGALEYASLAGPWAIVIVAVIIICTMIFGKKQKLNEQWNYWIIYKMVAIERYVSNSYGYDYRIVKGGTGSPTNFDGFYKLIYAEIGDDPVSLGNQGGSMKNFTGTMKPGDFKTMIKNWFNQKKQLIVCLGWEESAVPSASIETDIVTDYPKCKALSFSCNKRNTTRKEDIVNPFFKTMTNQYMGALNGVSIVVPFDGDYELKAYDKYDNLLSSVIVTEDDFLSPADGKAGYAQAMFGLNMSIASGVSEGTNKNACRYDLMTEWGGGVSGIYYENDNTGMYSGCDKSNDSYVADHSATKLTVRSLTTDKPFVVQLSKPLPFANRVFLVTLNEKEIRKYRCYGDFGKCETSDFITSDK